MKKIFLCIFLFYFVFTKISANENSDCRYIRDLTFTICIKNTVDSYNLNGYMKYNKGELKAFGNGTFIIIIDPEYEILKDYFEFKFSISYIKNLFDLNRKNLNFTFPTRYKVIVPFSDIKSNFNESKQEIDIYLTNAQIYPTTCQAIVIDNLNIRDKPAFEGKKIGLLKRRAEVTLYEESKNIDEIDGEKNPWYKVKLEDGTYGWVYGGYVRIFFEDPNLGYSDKEQILKSIE